MTLHLYQCYECVDCKTSFVPYSADVKCPVCDTAPEEILESFVHDAADSAHYNLLTNGSYMPCAWATMDISDHILWHLFIVLEQHRKHGENVSFHEIADRYFVPDSDVTHSARIKHVKSACIAIYEYIATHPRPQN